MSEFDIEEKRFQRIQAKGDMDIVAKIIQKLPEPGYMVHTNALLYLIKLLVRWKKSR